MLKMTGVAETPRETIPILFRVSTKGSVISTAHCVVFVHLRTSIIYFRVGVPLKQTYLSCCLEQKKKKLEWTRVVWIDTEFGRRLRMGDCASVTTGASVFFMVEVDKGYIACLPLFISCLVSLSSGLALSACLAPYVNVSVYEPNGSSEHRSVGRYPVFRSGYEH